MKDSGVDWIGEIPLEWKVVPTKSKFTNSKEIVGDREIEFERLALTLNGVIKKSKENSGGLQPEKFETYQILYKDELIFKLIDLENVKTSRVGYSPFTGLVSPVYIRLSNPKESKFGYYYFINMWYQQVFNYLGSGVRSNLTSSDLLNVPYLDVPYEHQEKIIKILDEKISKVNDIISNTHKSIEELKKYRKSLIAEVVTKGLDKSAELKDSGIEWIGKIPKNWTVTKIGKISELSSGGTPPSNSSEHYDGEIPWARSLDLKEKEILKTDRNLSELGLSVISGGIIGAGAILIAMYGGSGTIGNSGLLKINASTNQAICAIQLRKGYYNRFYFYFIQFLRPYWMIYAVGTRKDPNISKQTVQNMPCLVLSLEEQKEIADFLDSKTKIIEDLIIEKEIIINEYEKYKQSLIYEYVTGKKQV